MKKLLTFLTLLTVFIGVTWATTHTGTIYFGNNGTKINSASVTGNDSEGNTWTITTTGTTSFTQSTNYSQVGSSNNPATKITFTTTFPSSVNFTSVSAKFGGFSGTDGSVYLKVGTTSIGGGNLNGTSDVLINSHSSASGTTLTVEVSSISKGVKCYYISYTYDDGGTTPTTYTVTCNDNVANGTISASPTSAAEGATVTLTATPDAGYQFGSWNVKDASNNSIAVNNNQFTMPASNVTVDATFTALPTYNITVTGGTASLTSAYEGQTVTLTPTIPDGKVVDWENTTVSPSTLEINHSDYTFTMPNQAVSVTFAFKDAPNENTATLTNANIVDAGTAATGYKTWTMTDDNNKTWSAYAIKNYHSNATSDYHYLQLKKSTSSEKSYLQVPEYGTKITKLEMTVSNTSQPMTGGGNTATLFFSSSNTTTATGTGVASGTGASKITIDCSDLDLNTGYITTSAGIRIWDVIVTYTNQEVVRYTIEVSQPSTGGNISASTESATEGSTVTITAEPTLGYKLSTVTVTCEDANVTAPTATINGNTATFEMPGSNVTVTASFSEIETISYDLVTNDSQLSSGTYILVSANHDGVLGGITDINGTQVGAVVVDGFDFNTDYTKIEVSSADVQELTLSGDANGYTLSTGNAYLSWESGNSLTTATEVSDNSKWTISINGEDSYKASISNVSETSRLIQFNGTNRVACYTSAQTKPLLYKKAGAHNITLIQPEVGGTISASATTADANTTITLIASPAEGYQFSNWNVYKTGETTTTVTVTDNVFTMPDYDVTIEATFTSIEYNISRTIRTNGNENTDGGWLGAWSGCSTVGEANSATSYEVKATAGSKVSFKAGTNNGYQIYDNQVSAVDANNNSVELTAETTDNSGITFSFTMPASAVAITANFTTTVSELYILGTANDNGWAGNVGVKMDYDNINEKYTKDVYFAGTEADGDNPADPNGYFSFTESLGNADWSGMGTRYGAKGGDQFDLASHNYTGELSWWNEYKGNAFKVPAGIYTIEVPKDKGQVTVIPKTITVTLTPGAENPVQVGSTVNISSNLTSLLQAIDENKSATLATSTDGTNYTDGSSYTFTTSGSIKVYGKAYFGHILATADNTYTVVESFDYDIVNLTEDSPYEEELVSSQGKFVIENNETGGLDAVWKKTSYGMTANGYGCTSEIESWFVSPLISATSVSATNANDEYNEIILDFYENLRYFIDDAAMSEATLWVREGSNGDWKPLIVSPHETVNSNSFHSVSSIDLSEYIGKVFQLGFKYTATEDNPGRWELKNFSVKVNSYTYTEVENIAEYNALDIPTDHVRFKNPVIVQYHYISSSKNYIYIKDDTGCAYINQPYLGTTGSISQLENGDIIGGGFSGDKVADEVVTASTSNYAQFTNLHNFAPNGDKGLADPEQETVAHIADATTGVALNNHYITIKKVKLSNLYEALSYGGAKYFDIDNEAHIGYNKFNIDWSVVDDVNAYYNITGIFTAYNNTLEFHPTEIVKWEESVVTLRELCKDGVTNENYTISNNLMCVFAKGNSIWVKDDTGQSIWMTSPAESDANFEVYAEAAEGIDANTRLNQAYYDQSNWCEIVLADGVDASQFVGQIIKGGTIHGEFTDKLNPTLENVTLTDAAISSEGDYVPNYYIPANFIGRQACQNSNHSTDFGQFYFYMTPKPQEYAQIVWAVWDDEYKKFIMSTSDNDNGHRFEGEFSIDLSLNTGVTATGGLQPGYGYNFKAIIKKTESKDAGYMVYPLDLDEGVDPATAIESVVAGNGEVKSVKYVNVAGMVSDVPFQGVNIVVTEYTDGSRTTSKMLRK